MKGKEIIKNLIREGETERLEFKLSVNKKSIASVVCSFLNGDGGQILIGVDDNRKIVGINNAEQISQELQFYLLQEIVPEAPVTVSVEQYDAKELISIKVWSGSKKPYLFDGGIFYRRASYTVKASSEELSKLIHDRQQTEIHWERQPVLGVELDDFDLDEINKTIKNSLTKLSNKKDILDFLSHYGLFLNGHFTNAAVVLFAKNPAKFLPQCRIRLTYFRAGKTDATVADDRLLEDNLFKNIATVQDFFTTHLEHKTSLRKGTWLRQDDLQYPLLALREGVLNALVHRNYSSISGSVSISIFPDRLEITNSGSLPFNPDRLKKNHISFLVNPDIAHIIFLRGFIEKIGSGTLKIIEACKEADLKEPVWESVSNTVKLTFFSNFVAEKSIEGIEGVIEGVTEGVTEEVKDKLKIVLITIKKGKQGLKVTDISRITNIPISSLERYIKQLRDAKLIEFRGAPKTGGYYLTKISENQINENLK